MFEQIPLSAREAGYRDEERALFDECQVVSSRVK